MISVTEFINNGGDMVKVSVSNPDKELAKEEPAIFEQGFIARNPKNHEDLWYVAKKYFDDNLEPATASQRELKSEMCGPQRWDVTKFVNSNNIDVVAIIGETSDLGLCVYQIFYYDK